MKVSLKTIEPYVTIPVSKDELVDAINKQLGGVEEIIEYSDKYRDVVIVSVVECYAHPNADKLSVCMVDDAGVVDDVERDERGLVRVVCGADNVRSGMLAAWLPPRSTVPSTYDTGSEFVLDARELRGIKSNGMLAASDELAIGTDHEGIVEINPDEWNPYGTTPTAGAFFADVYALNDTVIDIENKMFTHRPDCFGQVGVAREIAGILDVEFRQPEWLSMLPEFTDADGLELNVENQARDVVSRFMAVGIKDITIKKSPLWMQCELMRLGSKSINNVVDLTNYMMLMTGQPTHAYDYDTLRGANLVTRMAREGEIITLLNGKSYTLSSDDIVIADNERAIGLAGIMGGHETEVTDQTTSIVLEVATFDMYAVRKSSMRHGVFTDALTRFNKGQSPHQNPYIISRLLASITDVTRGAQATRIFDESDNLPEIIPVEISVDFINDRLGSQLQVQDVQHVLRRTGFNVELLDNGNVAVTAPYWRTDIILREDIVEEVGRLRGFDELPKELPQRVMSPAPKNKRRVFKQLIRSYLSKFGANEILTYSFVPEKSMIRSGQNSEEAFQLSNALSPDLQNYRLSILPSLIEKAVMNGRAGYDETLLFEIGKTHNKKIHRNDDGGLPKEIELVEGIYSNRQPEQGAAYFVVRRVIDQLMHELGVEVMYTAVHEMPDTSVAAPFNGLRSALIHSANGVYLGIVGELKQSVHANFKLAQYSAAFSLELEPLQAVYELTSKGSRYKKLSRFPSISQDITLRTDSNVKHSDIYDVLKKASMFDDIAIKVSAGDIYQPKDDATIKTTTFHLDFVSYERTLADEDVRPIVNKIAQNAHDAVGAVLV